MAAAPPPARPLMLSPREVDLGRFAYLLGHISNKPVAELLISKSTVVSIDPEKQRALRNCLDERQFESCSIPSLDLKGPERNICHSSRTNLNRNRYESRTSKSASAGTGEEDASSSKVTDESDQEDVKAPIITELDNSLPNVNKNIQNDTKDEVSKEINSSLQQKDGDVSSNRKLSKQLTPTDGRSAINASDAIHCTVNKNVAPSKNDLDHSSSRSRILKNLNQPNCYNARNIHEAPTQILRGIGLSMNSLIEQRAKAWVEGMLRNSFGREDWESDDKRHLLLSLMTINDAITLVKATSSFQALPAIIPNTNAIQSQSAQTYQNILLPLTFNIDLNYEMGSNQVVSKIQFPGSISGSFIIKTQKLRKVEIDLDPTIMLAVMTQHANQVALKMIRFAANEALTITTDPESTVSNDPELNSRLTRCGSLTANEYSSAALAQVPTLKRSLHLCPSNSDISKAKRIKSKLGLVRNNASYNDVGSGELSLKRNISNNFNATMKKDKVPLPTSSSLAFTKKRSAVTWTDLSDHENVEGATKRTKNAGWGSAILKNGRGREFESTSSMKRTISSGASTIVRSMKSSKNSTFADFGRVGSYFNNTGTSSSSLAKSSVRSTASFSQLRRPQSKNRSFLDLKRPCSTDNMNANATFDLSSSVKEKINKNRFSMSIMGVKK